MSHSLRKIIGTLVILLLMAIYALLATTYAAANLGDAAWYVHLAYFLFTGILWILPAMAIIKWMLKPQKP